MGIIKSIFQAVKHAKAQGKLYEKYKAMTKQQLLELDDEELYLAVNSVCEYDVDDENLSTANEIQRTFYVINEFDMEVNNGGLCQFFVNSSRVCAPYVSDCLEKIGAVKTKEHFDRFISENGIDLENLNSSIIDSVKEYEAQTKRYPFDDFDDLYYETENIRDFLVSYARKNIELLMAR